MALVLLLHFFIILTCVPLLTSLENRIKTQICVKNMQKKDGFIAESSQSSFYRFIEESDIFVDRSLLIKELMSLLETHDTLVITAPGKWGKSLNFQMVKFFLDIELDSHYVKLPQNQTKSYNFFVEGEINKEDGSKNNFNNIPLISKNTDFIIKHLANYVAVYIDFSSFTGLIASYFPEYKKTISQIFKEYSAVVERLCISRFNSYNKKVNENVCSKEEFQNFQNIYRKLEKEESKWVHSLNLLSHLLKQYYEADIIFLLDEFDSLINKMYFTNSKADNMKKNISIKFLEQIYQAFLKENHNVRSAIITGTLPLMLHNKLPSLNNNTLYLKHTKEPLLPYYGFTKLEVEQLLAVKNFEENTIGDIIDFYNSYEAENEQKTKLFKPLSIVKFLNSEILQNYWSNSGNQILSTSIIKNIKAELALVNLLRDQCEYLDLIEDSLGVNEFLEIARVVINESQIDNKGIIDDGTIQEFYLWYFYIQGLVTKVCSNDGKFYMKIPNNENTAEITRVIFNREITYGDEEPAARALLKSIENYNYSTVDDFGEEVQELLIDETRKKSLLTHELFYHIKLYYVLKTAVKLNSNFVDATEPVQIVAANSNRTKFELFFPNLSIHNYTRCGVIEVLCNVSREDLEFMEPHGFRPYVYGNNMLHAYLTIKQVRVIRVHILPDQTIEVSGFYRFIVFNGTTVTEPFRPGKWKTAEKRNFDNEVTSAYD